MAVEEPFVMEHCRSALKCLEQLAGRVFTRSCVVSDDSGLVCGQLMAHSLMNIEGQFHHHQDQRRWCVGRCFCKPIVYAISVRRWKSYVSVGGVGHNRVGSRSKQTMPMIPYRWTCLNFHRLVFRTAIYLVARNLTGKLYKFQIDQVKNINAYLSHTRPSSGCWCCFLPLLKIFMAFIWMAVYAPFFIGCFLMERLRFSSFCWLIRGRHAQRLSIHTIQIGM